MCYHTLGERGELLWRDRIRNEKICKICTLLVEYIVDGTEDFLNGDPVPEQRQSAQQRSEGGGSTLNASSARPVVAIFEGGLCQQCTSFGCNDDDEEEK